MLHDVTREGAKSPHAACSVPKEHQFRRFLTRVSIFPVVSSGIMGTHCPSCAFIGLCVTIFITRAFSCAGLLRGAVQGILASDPFVCVGSMGALLEVSILGT